MVSNAMVQRVGLALLILATTANTAPAMWYFSGLTFGDDFESDPFPGWSGASTSPGPFGGRVLGPANKFQLFLMDFGYDLLSEPTLVDLSFVIDPPFGPGGLVVSFNGEQRQSELVPSSFPPYHARIASYDIPFPYPDSPPDLEIIFSYPNASPPYAFTLDNVVMDWSQTIPEPAGWIVMSLVLPSLLTRRWKAVYASASETRCRTGTPLL